MGPRTAVIGVGGIGSLHALTLRDCEFAELVAVVDASVERAARVGSDLGVAHYQNVEELLSRQNIEAAVVAVPDTAHLAVSAPLLEAGIAVMLEKPIASSVEEGLRLASLAAITGTPLFIAHVLRFDPRYVAAHDAVRSGELGEPLHFIAGRLTLQSRHNLVRNSSSAPFDLGVHDIDAVQWITGRRITQVHAYGSPASDGPPAAVVATCLMEGGVIGQIYCGWTRPDTWPNAVDSQLDIGCRDGVARVRIFDDGGLIVAGSDHRLVDALNARHVRGIMGGNLFDEARHFFRCLATSDRFVIELEEALAAVAVAESINRSVVSGIPEEVRIGPGGEGPSASSGGISRH